MSVFTHCKDIEVLISVNLIDNYVPLVLSINSVVFKSNSYNLYCASLCRCWIMFMVFHRRHYDKALLLALSTFKYLQAKDHPMHHTIQKFLVAFDKYPVENFDSGLGATTFETDFAEQIREKAKEMDICQDELQAFQSPLFLPRQFSFSRKRINGLKKKAVEFWVQKFRAIDLQPGIASQLPRKPRQNKEVSEWLLPHLFGKLEVTNKVLPLGFSHVKQQPNSDRKLTSQIMPMNLINDQ